MRRLYTAVQEVQPSQGNAQATGGLLGFAGRFGCGAARLLQSAGAAVSAAVHKLFVEVRVICTAIATPSMQLVNTQLPISSRPSVGCLPQTRLIKRFKEPSSRLRNLSLI